MKSSVVTRFLTGLSLLVSFNFMPAAAHAQVEKGNEALWYFSPCIGWMDFEGDEELDDGGFLTLRLGYDWSEPLTFEGSVYLAPKLDERIVGVWSESEQALVPQSRLDAANGFKGVHDTFSFGAAFDALLHFTRWERVDPYLTLGAVAMWYDAKMEDGKQLDAGFRYGGGMMYHFNDEWAIRADIRTGFKSGSSDAIQANSLIDAGIVWTWGARIAPEFTAIGGPTDSDHDGLNDADELKWGTDPYDPDTDKDGLTDGEEVHTYHTDPLNPDSDWDGLKDGPEVKTHKTDPLLRDTDHGGVSDGHEVLEDDTDPNNPKDDLRLIELYIQFDYDKAIVKPQYFPQLEIIGKTLTRNSKAVARVEGHCDQIKTKKRESSPRYNMKLSEKRAEAVVDYLVKFCKIEKKRLTPVGYGFTRPKEKPDLLNGNPNNRRVEIYIKGAEGEDAINPPGTGTATAPAEEAAPAAEAKPAAAEKPAEPAKAVEAPKPADTK
jgi:outer membrane protein OmpA-like peptidoglycan-associated protein